MSIKELIITTELNQYNRYEYGENTVKIKNFIIDNLLEGSERSVLIKISGTKEITETLLDNAYCGRRKSFQITESTDTEDSTKGSIDLRIQKSKVKKEVVHARTKSALQIEAWQDAEALRIKNGTNPHLGL